MRAQDEGAPLRRVLVKGGSGGGKTTLARRIASKLGVRHIELDALYHGPGWRPTPPDEFRAKVDAALAGLDGWVVDGNYDSKLGDDLLERADLIVWLDLPLALKLRRLSARTIRRIRSQEALWNGNRESWRGAFWGRDSLLVWAARTHFRHRRDWPALFATRRVERLRSGRDVAAFLHSLDRPTSREANAARLVLICGLPAAGKTTLARELADAYRAVRFNPDEWELALDVDPFDEAFQSKLETQFWELTQQLLVLGTSVILEWGFWARSERDEMRETARRIGVPVELRFLDVPYDELVRRVAARRAAGGLAITETHMELYRGIFQAPTDEELSLFDPPLEPFGAPAGADRE